MSDLKPDEYATYRGDRRQILSEGPKGPSTTGETFQAISADYDPESDRTRVGFASTTRFANEVSA